MTYVSEVLADAPLGYWRLGDHNHPEYISMFASSNYGSEPPSNAFDNNQLSFWTTNGGSTGFVGAQTAVGRVLTSYAMRRRNDIPNRNPKTWTFEGSNNGTSWAVLDTQTNITWPDDVYRVFTFTNATAYTYYRLNITANQGDGYLSVCELIMPPTATIPMAVDSSGNNRDGKYPITATYETPSLITGSTDFATTWGGSVDSRVEVPYGSWMNTSDFASDVVIVPSSLVGLRTIISRNTYFCLRLNAGILELKINSATNVPQTLLMPTQLVVGQKYHVGFSYINGSAKLYLNGAVVANASGWSKLVDTGSILQIGTLYDTAQAFAGIMDEAAFYGTGLSDSRFAAHSSQVPITPIVADIPIYVGSSKVSKMYLGDTPVDGSKLGGSSVY